MKSEGPCFLAISRKILLEIAVPADMKEQREEEREREEKRKRDEVGERER